MAKTAQDVKNLKVNWLNDPCWDIEDTEGFEDWRNYLKAWRKTHQTQCQQAEAERLQNRAAELDCNVSLVLHIERLERRIEEMAERLRKVEYGHAE